MTQVEMKLWNMFLGMGPVLYLRRLMGGIGVGKLMLGVFWELFAIVSKVGGVVFASQHTRVPLSTLEMVTVVGLLEHSASEDWKSRTVSAIISPFGRLVPNMCYRLSWISIADYFGYTMLESAVAIFIIELFLYAFTAVFTQYCALERLCFSTLLCIIYGFFGFFFKLLMRWVLPWPCGIEETLKSLKGDWKCFVEYVEKEDVQNVVRCLEKMNPGCITNKNLLWFLIWFMTDLSAYPAAAMIRLLLMLERPLQKLEPCTNFKYVNSLHVAVVCGNVKKVKVILKRLKHFDVNLKGTLKSVDSNSQTPLMMACGSELKGKDEIIKLILAYPKIDINAKTDANLTALKIAFKKVLAGKCMNSFKLLLGDPRLDVNTKLDGNRTPLMMTIDHLKDEERREIVLELILKHPKLDVNMLGNPSNNYTALHHAVEEDQPNTVKALLKIHKTCVNAKTNSEKTPLILAALRNNPHCLEIVKLFVSTQNIEINAVDADSKTAIGRALDNQNLKLVELLDNNKQIDENKVRAEDIQTETQKSERTKSVKCCWSCGEEDIKLFKCGGCMKAFYCGDKCIQTDWEVHQRWCSKMKEKRQKKKNILT